MEKPFPKLLEKLFTNLLENRFPKAFYKSSGQTRTRTRPRPSIKVIPKTPIHYATRDQKTVNTGFQVIRKLLIVTLLIMTQYGAHKMSEYSKCT